MPIDLNQDLIDLDSLSGHVVKHMEKIVSSLHTVQNELLTDEFNTLLSIPRRVSGFKAHVDQIVAAGVAGEVRQMIADNWNYASLDFADINNFYSACLLLRTDIINNSSLFLMTFNGADNYTFITPVSSGVKTGIETRITDILAHVTST